jgi:hypothetical protein
MLDLTVFFSGLWLLWNTPSYPVGVPGEIPPITTRFCDATQPPYNADSSGSTDATAAINQALANCPANQYVYLPAGTYLVTGNNSIHFPTTYYKPSDHKVLRGAGSSTIIKDTGGSLSTIQLGTDTTWASATSVPITIPPALGSNTLTVADASKFRVGEMVVLNQDNDGYEVYAPDDFGLPGGQSTRLMRQVTQIQSISGNQITILPASLWNWSLALNPRLNDMGYLLGTGDWKISFCGVENLLIDRSAAGGTCSVLIDQAFGCWLSGVKSVMAPAYHFVMEDSLECTVTNCWVENSQRHVSNGGGLILYRRDCNCEVSNNIFHKVFPALETNSGSCGNVIAYNYARDNFTDSGLQGAAFDACHGSHSALNLFEGNVGANLQADGYYGSSSRNVIFRNYFSGVDEDSGLLLNSKCIDLCRDSLFYTVVNNVLGRTGISTVEEYSDGTVFPYSTGVIYRLGYPYIGNNSTDGSVNPPSTTPGALDSRVKATLTRLSNYDVVTSVHPYPYSLPASLYLKAKPSWWGNAVWPPIGQDVSNLVNPIPAQLRYAQ